MSKKIKKRSHLSDIQEGVVRQFLDDCVTYEIALDRTVIGLLIDNLGYKVVTPGKLVRKDREIKHIFGDPDPFRNIEDEYGPDGEALRERLNAANNSESTDEASTGEPTESDSVGDVLQQDV